MSDDICGRCKRRGELCTLTSLKHRSIHRSRNASISAVPRERPLGSSSQLSASSSLEYIGHDQRDSLDEQMFTSSPLTDCNMDDSELGQQPLEKPIEDRIIPILPTLDLPSQGKANHTGDQDTHAIFNLALSPLEFFSTPMPSTQLEPTQKHTAAKVLESFLMPSPSSEDETAHSSRPTDLDLMTSIYDSPTSLFHSPSLFETTLLATKPSPLLLPSIPAPFSNQPQPCHCLAAGVFAVEEFEAKCNSGNRGQLDSIVACQKQATKCCRSMLHCSSCMAKRENLVLLVFVTERIVAACGRIVILYCMKDGDDRAGSLPSSLLGCLPDSDRFNAPDRDTVSSSSFASSSRTDSKPLSSPPSTGTTTPSDWRELLLGDYEISSPVEWEQLVRVLINLQLRAVRDLLADMKKMGSKILRDTQTASLAEAQQRVCELEKDIRTT